jgi:hypothetical protein
MSSPPRSLPARLFVVAQYLHVATLVLLPVLFAAYRLGSEEHDRLRFLITIGFTLLAVLWSAAVFVSTAVTSDNERLLKAVRSWYQRKLRQWPFLVTSNLLLLVSAAFLTHQLVFYRQVPFRTAAGCSLILHPDTVPFASGLKGGETKIRMPVGVHLVLAKGQAGAEALDPIAVDWFWRPQDMVETNCGV